MDVMGLTPKGLAQSIFHLLAEGCRNGDLLRG